MALKKHILTLTLAALTAMLLSPIADSYGQVKSLPEFLQEKQIWNEKLVVIYAPAQQQYLVKEQINALHTSINRFKTENIVVVQIPTALSISDKLYLKQKLRYQQDRINIWVFDEKGNLRMSSTKVNTADQFLRVLNLETRPEAVAKARNFWND